MKYQITVVLNEKGRKLVTNGEHVFQMYSVYNLTPEEIEKTIYDEVPREIIESYSWETEEFIDLVVGDYVKITEETDYCTSSSITTVSEITGDKVKVKDSYTIFDLTTGKEKSRKKKNLSYISIPEKSEVDSYLENHKRESLTIQIKDLINLEYKLESLETWELEDIVKTLKREDKI